MSQHTGPLFQWLLWVTGWPPSLFSYLALSGCHLFPQHFGWKQVSQWWWRYIYCCYELLLESSLYSQMSVYIERNNALSTRSDACKISQFWGILFYSQPMNYAAHTVIFPLSNIKTTITDIVARIKMPSHPVIDSIIRLVIN